MKKPLALIIMDGFGLRKETEGNAIAAAKHPNLDRLWATCPHTQIGASGLDVGLPDGQMGNSEVGHTNMGAGRIVYQELTRITKSIEEGEYLANPALVHAMENAKKPGAALHLMGLLSDGGVHSHNRHLYGLIEMAKKSGVEKVFIHCFMDGRDVPPTSGAEYIDELQQELDKIGVGKIATVSGRYYAMDRDNRWERVVKAYDAMVNGEGVKAPNPVAMMRENYKNGVTDEFTVPAVVTENAAIRSGDSVIFFNFRPDRARELTRALVDPDFAGFRRKKGFFPLVYICMTQYDATMPNVEVAYKPEDLTNTFGEYISKQGLTQLRIAETEKYAHVTFFFNGGREAQFEGESRILVPSPKVATYDLQPEMSAELVTDKLAELLDTDKYDMIILNFANPDMVGHTGVLNAAVKAMETVDACVGRIVEKVLSLHGTACITADHGNLEKMLDETTGQPYTAHTTNQVPFLVVSDEKHTLHEGILADIAPTLLELLKIKQPAAMTGKSLLTDKNK